MAISQYPLRRTVNAGIKYNLDFASLDACVAARLDAFRWEHGGYPPRFMNRIIAWHKLRGLISTHIEDAKAIAAEKESKRKGKR